MGQNPLQFAGLETNSTHSPQNISWQKSTDHQNHVRQNSQFTSQSQASQPQTWHSQTSQPQISQPPISQLRCSPYFQTNSQPEISSQAKLSPQRQCAAQHQCAANSQRSPESQYSSAATNQYGSQHEFQSSARCSVQYALSSQTAPSSSSLSSSSECRSQHASEPSQRISAGSSLTAKELPAPPWFEHISQNSSLPNSKSGAENASRLLERLSAVDANTPGPKGDSQFAMFSSKSNGQEHGYTETIADRLTRKIVRSDFDRQGRLYSRYCESPSFWSEERFDPQGRQISRTEVDRTTGRGKVLQTGPNGLPMITMIFYENKSSSENLPLTTPWQAAV